MHRPVFERPWLASPWLEWCFLDSMIWREMVALMDTIIEIRQDKQPSQPSLTLRVVQYIGRKRRQAAVEARVAPMITALGGILNAYVAMGVEGWTLSPTRVRELMVAAEDSNARWSPCMYALVDSAIKRDAAVWRLSTGPRIKPWDA